MPDDDIESLRACVAALQAERECLPVPMVALDAENRFTEWNRAAEKLFGWSKEEVLGRYPVPWFVPAELEARMLGVVETLKRGEQGEHCAVPIPTKAGGLVVCDWHHTPVLGPDGAYAGRTAVGSDVTARVKAEDAVRETITRSPLAAVEIDADLRVVDWNPAAEKLFGWSKDEVLGRTITGLILPEVMPGELDPLVGRIRAGDMDVVGTNENFTRDGRILVCEWFNTPHLDAEGRFLGNTGLAVDRTEQTRAREALRDSITRLPLALVRVDAAWRVTEWNPAAEALFGWRREEALGADALTLIVPPELRPGLGELQARIEAGVTEHSTNENVTRDGRRIVCGWHNLSHVRPDGTFAGITALAEDVTERVRIGRALKEANLRLRVLSRRIVDVQEAERRHIARELHDEIGGVLSAIAVNLQAVKVGQTGAIDDCIGAIDRTINQVRRLSLNLRPGMLDSLGLSATLRWLVSHVAVPAGLTVHTDIVPSGEPPPGELATACFRVAQEALTNVVRHARATSVWVTMEQEDGASVSVSVRDDGIGFDRETELARAGRGESLGLLGIRERVELFEGRLEIDSAPGKGTQIRVWFPVRQPI